MKAIFVDSSVLLLPFGGEHPDRAACSRLLELAATGRVRLHASVEAGQEFLFHRLRRGATAVAVEDFDALDRLVVWHDFDSAVLRRSRDLVEAEEARGRDAVHAGTALCAGVAQIVTTDQDFEGITGLDRVDPRDLGPADATS